MRAWGAAIAVVVVVVDLVTKWSILELLAARPGGIEVTPFLNIVLVMNPGVSFGLIPIQAAWGPWLFSGIAAIIVVFLGVWLTRADRLLLAVGLGLVIGGAIGNVIDRLRYGGVVDFLDFHIGRYHWPAFNAADTAIVVGVAALLLANLFGGPDRPTNKEAGDT